MSKIYNYNGLLGCVKQAKNRITKTIISVYQAEQAGIESDTTLPFATVCEEHGTLVCHTSQALAIAHMADPTEWCEDCRKKFPKS